jgi:hypothetical protein
MDVSTFAVRKSKAPLLGKQIPPAADTTRMTVGAMLSDGRDVHLAKESATAEESHGS